MTARLNLPRYLYPVVVVSVLLRLLPVVSSQPSFSYPFGPAELVNLNGPGVVLAYANSLVLDDSDVTNQEKTLYFLADKGASNVFVGKFLTQGGQYSFWVEPVSPFHKVPELGPFLNFDVLGNNLIGIALPNNDTMIGARGPFIQSIYNGTDQVYVYQTLAQGFDFVSTYVSPFTDGQGNNYVYFAGWNMDLPSSSDGSFIIARGTVKLNNESPIVVVKWASDVLHVPMSPPCYDQLSERNKPYMNATSSHLILLLSGRCSIFVKVPLTGVINFSGATPIVFYPKNTSKEYIPSAIYDSTYNTIYYTKKTYQSSGALFYTLNMENFTFLTEPQSIDLKESEAIAVLGSERINNKDYRWIFIIGSGSNKIIRFQFDGSKYINILTTRLDPSINKVSSALYYRPWLFYTTYEPDAKLVRIVKSNFCQIFCGDHGYCSQGFCVCDPGYAYDYTHVDEGCVPVPLADAELNERRTNDTTIALGVLFGFTVLTAIVGWALWWQTQKNLGTEKKPLVVSSRPTEENSTFGTGGTDEDPANSPL